MQKLMATETTLGELEQRVASVKVALALPQPRSMAKSELAQIEAKAKQLEARGVDDVSTSDLHSGRAAVKDLKKQLLQRLERLFADMEELFQKLS
mmetsp:Transcript_60600/g.141721  ORF Transcript_60600/g.141721 Transcript_60600/m.141721 type:complete len:95 (+) Transcript_60600:2-286(+)